MSTIPPNLDQSQPSEVGENFPGFQSPERGLILIQSISPQCTAPNRPFLKAINAQNRQIILFQPDCKTWSCPHCAEIRAAKWRTRAVKGFIAFEGMEQPVDFVTVTSHENLGASASLAVMSGAWDQLNKRMHRSAATADYFLVPEFHKDGRVHLHLLTTAHLKRKWWKDNARSCGFGYQSDVKEVKALGGVAEYVTKYLTKMLQNTNLPKHFRRVRTSRDWPKLPDMPQNPDWQFRLIARDVPLDHEQRVYQAQGYTVVIADSASAWDWISGEGWM